MTRNAVFCFQERDEGGRTGGETSVPLLAELWSVWPLVPDRCVPGSLATSSGLKSFLSASGALQLHFISDLTMS